MRVLGSPRRWGRGAACICAREAWREVGAVVYVRGVSLGAIYSVENKSTKASRVRTCTARGGKSGRRGLAASRLDGSRICQKSRLAVLKPYPGLVG